MDVGHPYLASGPSVMAISHAGDTDGGAIDGTLVAYRLAHDVGFRWFQVDVVAIGGGCLASAHAVFGRKRAWEHLAPAAVSVAAGYPVPTLDELMDALPDGFWNIEVKSRRAEGALLRLLDRPGVAERVCISTPFHRGMSRRLRQRYGDAVCLSAPQLDGGLIGLPLWPWRRIRHDAVQVWVPLVRSRWVVQRARRRAQRFQVWTVNSPAAIQRCLDLGVTGIITDRHAALLDRLDAQGCAHQ